MSLIEKIREFNATKDVASKSIKGVTADSELKQDNPNRVRIDASITNLRRKLFKSAK
jgi:hypothetical protein